MRLLFIRLTSTRALKRDGKSVLCAICFSSCPGLVDLRIWCLVFSKESKFIPRQSKNSCAWKRVITCWLSLLLESKVSYLRQGFHRSTDRSAPDCSYQGRDSVSALPEIFCTQTKSPQTQRCSSLHVQVTNPFSSIQTHPQSSHSRRWRWRMGGWTKEPENATNNWTSCWELDPILEEADHPNSDRVNAYFVRKLNEKVGLKLRRSNSVRSKQF